jgi:hypothetical protein
MVRKPIDDANRILQEAGGGNCHTDVTFQTQRKPAEHPAKVRNVPHLKTLANQRLKILVKVIAGRFIEIYCASELVDVLIINEPDVDIVNGLTAEQLLEKALPKVYADIHCQGYKVGSGEVEHLTAADIANRVEQMRFYDRLAISRAKQDRPTNLELLRAAMGAAR